MAQFVKFVWGINAAELHGEMEQRFYDPLRKKTKAYAGLDGMTSKQYLRDPMPLILAIRRQIITPSRKLDEQGKPKTPTRFVFTPSLQFEVPKPGSNKTRKLSMASIRNILAQKMMAKFMTPEIDALFIEHSYAYRPGKSSKQAIRQVQQYIKDGYAHVLDADITGFFDNVRHDILLQKVKKVFPDEPVLYHLIYRFIKTGWVDKPKDGQKLTGKIRKPFEDDKQGKAKGLYHSRKQGLPQGGILSGLLANLYLNDMDHELQRVFPQVRYVRYADDFLIFCQDFNTCWAVRQFVENYLQSQLGLAFNQKKTHYRQLDRERKNRAEPFVDFLGYRVCPSKVKIQPKNVLVFKSRMAEIIQRWAQSDKLVGTLIRRINRKIRGRLYEFNVDARSTMVAMNWTAYFSLITGHGQLKELDDWLYAEVLRAIRARGIKNHTRQTLRARKLHTLVRLHYKIRHEKARQFEEKAKQLKLSLASVGRSDLYS